jgi:hypothetical protein
MNSQKRHWLAIAVLMTSAAISGCSRDERVVQEATQAADRQARQNQEIARVANQAAEGSRQLVEADAGARREIVKVHQDLQAERADLGK